MRCCGPRSPVSPSSRRLHLSFILQRDCKSSPSIAKLSSLLLATTPSRSLPAGSASFDEVRILRTEEQYDTAQAMQLVLFGDRRGSIPLTLERRVVLVELVHERPCPLCRDGIYLILDVLPVFVLDSPVLQAELQCPQTRGLRVHPRVSFGAISTTSRHALYHIHSIDVLHRRAAHRLQVGRGRGKYIGGGPIRCRPVSAGCMRCLRLYM